MLCVVLVLCMFCCVILHHESVLWCALPISYHRADAVYKTAHVVFCTVLAASCSRAPEQGVCILQARPDQAKAEPLPAFSVLLHAAGLLNKEFVLCRPDQIKPELNRFLQMLKVVYGTFGLHYKMALSTRPEEKLGDDAMWDQAEGALQAALDETGLEWEVSQVNLCSCDALASLQCRPAVMA